MLFALKYPQMTDRLILNSGNIFPSGMKLSVRLPIEAGYVLNKALSKISKRAKKQAELLGLMANEPHIARKSFRRYGQKPLSSQETRI